MMTKTKRGFKPAIHRVPLGKLTIFEITEAELEALERGSPESLFLNLGIAAISIACSFLASLLAATVTDIKTYCVFVIVCVIGFLAGITFALLWWSSYRTLRKVAREIRSRMTPQGIQETTPTIEQASAEIANPDKV